MVAPCDTMLDTRQDTRTAGGIVLSIEMPSVREQASRSRDNSRRFPQPDQNIRTSENKNERPVVGASPKATFLP